MTMTNEKDVQTFNVTAVMRGGSGYSGEVNAHKEGAGWRASAEALGQGAHYESASAAVIGMFLAKGFSRISVQPITQDADEPPIEFDSDS